MAKGLTSRQYFTQMHTLYYAQAGIMMLFAGVVFTLVYAGQIAITSDQNFIQNIMYLTFAIVVAGLAGAFILYGTLVRKIDRTMDLKKKTPKYMVAILVRSACLEVSGMMGVIAFALTGRTFLMMVPLILLVAFILYRPTRAVMAQELNLNEKEIATLNNPTALVSEGNER